MIGAMSAPALQLDPPDTEPVAIWPRVAPWIVALVSAALLAFAVVERLSHIPASLEREARARLARASLPALSVAVDGRDVTLGGELDVAVDRRALVDEIEAIPGVRVVVDEIVAVDPRARALAERERFREALAAIDLSGVAFEAGSASLAPGSDAALAAVARLMRDMPGHRVRIGGHTDSRGRAATNVALSRERAAAVAADLADRGIERTRIIAKGYGATQPIADNDTEAGRARNRRIEIENID